MNILFYIISATVVVSLVSFVSILLFLKKTISKKIIKYVISLAAGALLGAVFFTLLPELFGHEHNEHEHIFEPATLSMIILIAILAFFFIEKYFHWHHCQCDQPGHEQNKRPMGYINLIGDGIHNFVDGTLIASTFLINPYLGITTTLAIILHEIPQEISDIGILIYSGFTKKKALMWNFVSALTAVAGGIIAYFFSQSTEKLLPVLLAIAIGSFLYLAMADIMPELHHENNSKHLVKQFSLLLIGVIVMYGVSLLGHGH